MEEKNKDDILIEELLLEMGQKPSLELDNPVTYILFMFSNCNIETEQDKK